VECEYEEDGEMLLVTMTEQCNGKNDIESNLEESLGLIDTNRHSSIRLDTWTEAAEIDVASCHSSQSRKGKKQIGKLISDVWVEVAHYSSSDDVKRVREKFTVCVASYRTVQKPSLSSLSSIRWMILHQRWEVVPWRGISYPFEACTEVLSSCQE